MRGATTKPDPVISGADADLSELAEGMGEPVPGAARLDAAFGSSPVCAMPGGVMISGCDSSTALK
ncbi:hypothetical protein [Rhizobium sp. IMFF44]|uniref:hypothetical protein n=1 Tax=Rhizobium sp. IMFF44 TaxID=3342350 RepID=UPI0035B6CDF6